MKQTDLEERIAEKSLFRIRGFNGRAQALRRGNAVVRELQLHGLATLRDLMELQGGWIAVVQTVREMVYVGRRKALVRVPLAALRKEQDEHPNALER